MKYGSKVVGRSRSPAVWLLADIVIADVNWEGTRVLDGEWVRGYIYRRQHSPGKQCCMA
jgi:hypothetical protein